MEIAFDTSALDSGFKEHAIRGIGRYVRELKRYFDSNSEQGPSISYFSHTDFKAPLVDSLVRLLPAGRMTIRQQLLYPFQLHRNPACKADLLHFPAHMDAPSWSTRRCVVTVLDLIPLVCADLYKADRPGWRFALARWLENRAIQNAALILAISENTARDVHNILGVAQENIRVTPLGVDQSFYNASLKVSAEETRAKFKLPASAPLVLYVGGIDQRKNTEGLLQSFKAVLEQSSQGTKPVLVMAGGIQGHHLFSRLLERIEQLGLSEQVFRLGYVSDQELHELLSLADLFFFPSLYEGFGLPVLEAMAAGCPVVSSNRSCMPEVLGEVGIGVDPEDYQACAEAMRAVINDSGLRERLAGEGVKQARKFSWDNTGKKTVEAYESLAV